SAECDWRPSTHRYPALTAVRDYARGVRFGHPARCRTARPDGDGARGRMAAGGAIPAFARPGSAPHGGNGGTGVNIRLKRTPGIYLVGFMGSGKSTVGRHLAHRMG